MSTGNSPPEGKLFVDSLRTMDVYERRRTQLRLLLKEISQSELAEKSGVSPSYINRSLKEPGEKGAKNMGEVTARKLEAGGRKPEGWLDGNQFGQATSIPPSGHFGTPAATLSEAGSFSALSRVAVVGTARLGDNGYYEEISSMAGAGDGSVLAQSDDPNAYALRVRGDSMFPAIRDGWYVVIEPNATPTPGEYVLIKLRDGQKMVKELILQRADSITVVSVNGDKRRTIMSDEIDNHYGIQAVVSILAPSKWRP